MCFCIEERSERSVIVWSVGGQHKQVFSIKVNRWCFTYLIEIQGSGYYLTVMNR